MADLGTRCYKNSFDDNLYTEMADFCNATQKYTIEDKGDWYEVVEIPQPSEEYKQKQEAMNLRSQLQAFLSDTDYAVIKCGELKLDLDAEYPGLSEKRAQARAKINELESEYAELRMAKPAYPILE